ncbi:hypothetical protein ACFC9X_14900, partial [Enterococcus faecalis]|uniref:hypothetical protein n=1 Tax=Enterococcus faecalis TaxID=1351 RepID=UPI0039A714B0
IILKIFRKDPSNKGTVTKIVSQSLSVFSCQLLVLAQKTAKYEELFLFGCSYYLMQRSFFTTS